MSAKIKSPAVHHQISHHPRNINDKNFKKVYWPFIPVITLFAALLALGLNSGTFNHVRKHPFKSVLAYSTSENQYSMLAETNTDREQYNEPPLRLNSKLSLAAKAKADDMAARNYWSHNTPDGTPPWSFVVSAGYSYQKVGENLATGFYNEEEAIKGWMASLPHRENMLDPAYTDVGFGFSNAPHFSAVGGGPATIFVAFYGQPSGSQVILASKTLNLSGVSNPLQNLSPAATHESTPISLALSQTQWAQWGPVGLAIMLIAISCFLITKHTRSIRRRLHQTEYYIWKHPLFDLSLLFLAGLILVLWQTIGLIK